jgi:hypothetical protein
LTLGIGLAARPSSLDGKRIGILWNAKTNANIYLKRVQECLEERFAAAEFVWHTKRFASNPVEPEGFDALRRCDAVVTAYGD